MKIELDADQRRAANAEARRATNVVAGAGTGKTTVLVERFMKLVREDGIAPDRILALTFTLKAAAEMRYRIHEAVAAEAPEHFESLFGAWIMNFHQFGLRLIRENAPAFGIDPDVGIMSSAQFARIKALLRRRFLEGRIEGVPADFGGVMPAPTKLESRFGVFFDASLKCRNDGIDAASLVERCREDDHPGYRAWVESVAAIGRAFDAELARRNLIDFTAMIAIPARRLIEDDALRRRYASRFDHVLVDEFQDTSRAQYELLGALSDAGYSTVTVVGDRKQSIYRWRDARVENVLEFPGSQEPLRTNYRSVQNILDIAYAFISLDDEFHEAADNQPLTAHRGGSGYPVVLFHPANEKDKDAESEALAAWIRHLTEGVPFDGLPVLPQSERLGVEDVAVLLRSLNAANGLPEIEAAFARHRIPYAIVGGAGAAETRALESWHAAMSLLLPGNRARELLAVLEAPPWSVPDAVLYELIRDVKKRAGGMDLLGDEDIARIQDERSAARVRELRGLVEALEARMVSTDFRSFVAWAIDESPLAIRLFADVSSPAVVQTVQDLVLEVLDAYEQVASSERPAGLGAFLDHLRAAIDDRRFRDESDVRLPSDRVRIMTIHQSKGLEFKAVAVPGIKPPGGNREHFNLSRDHGLFFSAKEAKDWSRHIEHAPDHDYEARMEAQEANCVFYVAMTRAEDHLWVSSPFPEGVRGKQESLFTRLLECVSTVDPVVVLREAPEIAPPAAARAAGTGAGETVAAAALDDALAAWSSARERVDARRAAPAPSAGVLDVVTWAELLTFRECPLRYRYRYRTRVADVLGTDDEETVSKRDVEGGISIPKGLTPAEYGVLVHAALERVFQGGAPAAGAVEAAAAAMPGSTVTQKAKDAAARLVDGVMKSTLGTPGDALATEQSFEVRLESLVVHGIFDRVERAADDTWRVIDYKVGVEDPAHEFQVQVYMWALERIHGAPAGGVVCYLRDDGAHLKTVAPPDSSAQVDALAASLERALRSGDYPATPGDVCAACAYRSTCPSSAA